MVILLCSQELESSKQVILKDPKWSHRVMYMKGSSLNDSDLSRCLAQEAVACFLLAPRPCKDKAKAVSLTWPLMSEHSNVNFKFISAGMNNLKKNLIINFN